MDKDTITSIVFLVTIPILGVLYLIYIQKKGKSPSNNTEIKIPHRSPMNPSASPTTEPVNPTTNTNIEFFVNPTVGIVTFLNRQTKHVVYTKKEKLALAIFMILFLYSIPMCAWPLFPFSPWHDELKALEPIIDSNIGYIIITMICGLTVFVLMLMIMFFIVGIITTLIMRSFMSKEEAKTLLQKTPPPKSGIDKIDLPMQKTDLFLKNKLYLPILKIIWR